MFLLILNRLICEIVAHFEILIEERPDGGETAVRLLFGDEPIDGRFQFLFIDVNKTTSGGEGFDDERRQPQTSFAVVFTKRRIRTVVVAVSQFPLVTCAFTN